ncbi:hypothetical protein [Limosilactobacillus mucosae]|uniref:Uncharacterized protein n=1 Tax=Limosilactobacillus mucosae TaxID=97478 RepID=A0AAJ1HSR5_LIMMU|nr:hypothetical protein [Limosilactobacillus mucosae]MDC2828980.1 hypothetical protein [Limosilactobacillus mucosae]
MKCKVEEEVQCVEFIDNPVFEIHGKQYSLFLEDSKMVHDVDKALALLPINQAGIGIPIFQHRVYEVPSLEADLALDVLIDCQPWDTAENSHYVSTNLEIVKAKLIPQRNDVKTEPEKVFELKE